ncbi:MAG: hypothetical protein WC801_03195 [Patescibacteria group bacterium]|jgi:hypothetical protein
MAISYLMVFVPAPIYKNYYQPLCQKNCLNIGYDRSEAVIPSLGHRSGNNPTYYIRSIHDDTQELTGKKLCCICSRFIRTSDKGYKWEDKVIWPAFFTGIYWLDYNIALIIPILPLGTLLFITGIIVVIKIKRQK